MSTQREPTTITECPHCNQKFLDYRDYAGHILSKHSTDTVRASWARSVLEPPTELQDMMEVPRKSFLSSIRPALMNRRENKVLRRMRATVGLELAKMHLSMNLSNMLLDSLSLPDVKDITLRFLRTQRVELSTLKRGEIDYVVSSALSRFRYIRELQEEREWIRKEVKDEPDINISSKS